MADEKSQFEAGPWLITVTRSHILRSKCEKRSAQCSSDEPNPCTVCRFSRELQLPWIPEMVFPRNSLAVQHESGVGLEFMALDALKMVDTQQETVHVAGAEQWKATRGEGLKEVKTKMKSFDWTFTTAYHGTLTSDGRACIQEEESDESIDYSKLKEQERIFFFDDVVLFEDELADNGTAVLRVKIRVMASGFFILLRYFLRVDDVLVRLYDTRIYHQANTNYLLREVSQRETKLPDARLSLSTLKDVNKLNDIIPITNITIHKLLLPR